jgi:hypothetical protein
MRARVSAHSAAPMHAQQLTPQAQVSSLEQVPRRLPCHLNLAADVDPGNPGTVRVDVETGWAHPPSAQSPRVLTLRSKGGFQVGVRDGGGRGARPYRLRVCWRRRAESICCGQVRAHAVVVATGATAKKLGLPSEHTFWSRGISACAICDGASPIFKGKELGVVQSLTPPPTRL